MVYITNVVRPRLNRYRLMVRGEVLSDNDGAGFPWEIAHKLAISLSKQKISVSLDGKVVDAGTGETISPWPAL